MLPLDLLTAPQLAVRVAGRVRARRLARGWTQAVLAERAGMSLSSLRRFERTGQVAFDALVRIAFALDATAGLGELFPDEPASLDEILEPRRRQRGRRR